MNVRADDLTDFNVGKQSVAWKEYCAVYWFKDFKESLDRCTDRRVITKILLKTALNTIQSITYFNYMNFSVIEWDLFTKN